MYILLFYELDFPVVVGVRVRVNQTLTLTLTTAPMHRSYIRSWAEAPYYSLSGATRSGLWYFNRAGAPHGRGRATHLRVLAMAS